MPYKRHGAATLRLLHITRRSTKSVEYEGWQMKYCEVRTFPNPRQDKAQAVKVLEESAEIYSEWQFLDSCPSSPCRECPIVKSCDIRQGFLLECADAITAISNFAASVGCEDMTAYIVACEKKNEKRGRYDLRTD